MHHFNPLLNSIKLISEKGWFYWTIFFLFFATPLISSHLVVDNFIASKWIWIYGSFSILLFFIIFKLLISKKNYFLEISKQFSGFLFFESHSNDNSNLKWAQYPSLLLKKIITLAGILFIFRVTQLLLHPFNIEIFSFYDLLFFIFFASIIALSNCNINLWIKSIQWPLLAANFLVVFRALFQFYESRFLLNQFSHEAFASSFGNVNILAEYILLCLPLLYFYSKKMNNFFDQTCLQILISSNLFLLYWIQSRSALLCLGLLLFIIFFSNSKKINFLNGMNLLVTTTIIFSFHLYWSNGELDQLKQSKTASNFSRYNLLKSSLLLSKDNPLGIGTEKFEFALGPYRLLTDEPIKETLLDKTPHNEFLRWTIEHGWGYLILTLVLLNYIGKLLWIKIKESHDQEYGYLFLMYFLILIIQSLFQFPFLNAYTFLFFSFLIGLFLKYTCELQQNYSLNKNMNLNLNLNSNTTSNPISTFNGSSPWIYKWTLMIFLFFTLIVNGALFVSEYYEVNAGEDSSKAHLSCLLMPSNWRSCVREAQLYLDAKNYTKSIELLESELFRNPNNFIAMRFLVLNLIATKQNHKACSIAQEYEHLLGGKGQFNAFNQLICSP